MIYFISDMHFGHKNVINFCKRPFYDVEEMDNTIIKNWNNTVKPEDTIYVLGDICFYQASRGIPLLKQLNGKKILIQGNHDKWSYTQYLKAGFIDVFQEVMIRIAGKHIRLSHFPYFPKDETDKHELRYPERRPINDNKWLLCGHVHEKWKVKDKQINVGVDQWDFKPVSLSQIERIIMLSEQNTE